MEDVLWRTSQNIHSQEISAAFSKDDTPHKPRCTVLYQLKITSAESYNIFSNVSALTQYLYQDELESQPDLSIFAPMFHDLGAEWSLANSVGIFIDIT